MIQVKVDQEPLVPLSALAAGGQSTEAEGPSTPDGLHCACEFCTHPRAAGGLGLGIGRIKKHPTRLELRRKKELRPSLKLVRLSAQFRERRETGARESR